MGRFCIILELRMMIVLFIVLFRNNLRIPLGGYVRAQGPAGGATHVCPCSTLNIILRLHCDCTKPFTTAVLLSVKSSQNVVLKGFGVWSVAFQVLSAKSFRPLALHPHASSSSLDDDHAVYCSFPPSLPKEGVPRNYTNHLLGKYLPEGF